MEFKREQYIQKLEAYKHNHLIKVVTGLRRVGKSYLLFKLFKRHPVECGVAANHIIEIALDDFAFSGYRNAEKMYHFVKEQLAEMHVPRRRIRMEIFGAPRDITKADGWPKDFNPAPVKLTVLRGIQEDIIEANPLEPLTVALERAGIPNNSRCRSGACGFCRCKLLAGNVFVPEEGDGRRWADKKYSYYHACSTYPLSDCKIKIVIK